MQTSKEHVVTHGVKMSEWQRTPKQLLYEYCQKQKRSKPIFRKMRNTEENKFKCRVILPGLIIIIEIEIKL